MLPFVVRPSGFPLSGINLESAAHSKKTCLIHFFHWIKLLSSINSYIHLHCIRCKCLYKKSIFTYTSTKQFHRLIAFRIYNAFN